jgi:hypothetical protein
MHVAARHPSHGEAITISRLFPDPPEESRACDREVSMRMIVPASFPSGARTGIVQRTGAPSNFRIPPGT